MKPTLTGKTLPLYQLKDKYVSKGFKEAEEVKRPSWLQNPGPEDPQFRDKALQKTVGPLVGVTQGLSFDGIGEGLTGPNGTYAVNSVPPDTDVAVGTTQVVSLDNTAFAVFDKNTGAVTAGPYNTNVLWSALGASAACDVDNDGDGIVKFDSWPSAGSLPSSPSPRAGRRDPSPSAWQSRRPPTPLEAGWCFNSTPVRAVRRRISRIIPSWAYGLMLIR